MKEEKKVYPFSAAKSLIVDGHMLAKSYNKSLNMVLTLLLESAIEEWSVPGMELKPRPMDIDSRIDEEKSLT